MVHLGNLGWVEILLCNLIFSKLDLDFYSFCYLFIYLFIIYLGEHIVTASFIRMSENICTAYNLLKIILGLNTLFILVPVTFLGSTVHQFLLICLVY